MKERLLNIFDYLLAQLNQASTIRGIILLITACGLKLSPEHLELIVSGGLFVAGLVGVIFPDHLSHGRKLRDDAKREQAL